MKKEAGITMVSLVVYVISFLIIAGIVGGITTYFYQNMQIMDTNAGSSAEYNKLNVYLLKQVKSAGAKVFAFGNGKSTDNPSADLNQDGTLDSYITFQLQDGTKNTFSKVGNLLYFNQAKLCEDVEVFSIEMENNERKSMIITVQIANKQYKTRYVLES